MERFLPSFAHRASERSTPCTDEVYRLSPRTPPIGNGPGRPPDERYASVHALAEAARARRIRTEARITETVDLQVQAVTADALAISDRSGPDREP